jgi:hypothetical protein
MKWLYGRQFCFERIRPNTVEAGCIDQQCLYSGNRFVEQLINATLGPVPNPPIDLDYCGGGFKVAGSGFRI